MYTLYIYTCTLQNWCRGVESQYVRRQWAGSWHHSALSLVPIVKSQHAATHCNTLQHTATQWHHSALSLVPIVKSQHAATHCNTLQRNATHCNTLQHTATQCHYLSLWLVRICKSQHAATLCNALQKIATHCCNTLLHTATYCYTLQHRGEARAPTDVECTIFISSKKKKIESHRLTPGHRSGGAHTHCKTLQHTATHCNALQHTRTHYCDTLVHTAVAVHTHTVCVAHNHINPQTHTYPFCLVHLAVSWLQGGEDS